MIWILMQIAKCSLRNIITGRSKNDRNSGCIAGVVVEMIDNVNQNEYNKREERY